MKITLTRGNDGNGNQSWLARHTGAGADDVMALFGTNVLPTPFSASVSPDVVLARIEELNPDAQVVIS